MGANNKKLSYCKQIVCWWNTQLLHNSMKTAFEKVCNGWIPWRSFRVIGNVLFSMSYIITGSIARSTTRQYLSYSEADFVGFFALQGWHVAPMVVKFGMEDGTFGPLYRAIFQPHRCNNKSIGPQNWIFYWDLIKMWYINAPQGHIPCAIFTKFAPPEFVPHFRMH